MERELHEMLETELAQLFRSHLKDAARAAKGQGMAYLEERRRFEKEFKARGLQGLLARCYHTERQHQQLRRENQPGWN